MVRVEALDRRACRKPPHLERIAEFIGGGHDQFDAGDERDAELFSESFDVFPDRLLQLVEWDRAEVLVVNFNSGQTFSINDLPISTLNNLTYRSANNSHSTGCAIKA